MPAIVDQYGNPVYTEKKFASAANRNDPGTPPMPIFEGDFSKLIPDIDRRVIVSCARAIFQNFGPVTDALIQKANNVVGRAWAPKFLGANKEWGKEVKEWLESQWFGACDVRGRAWDFKTLLWLDCVALDRDGDFLIYFTESESGYPLTQRISTNRIGMRGWNLAGIVSDGPYRNRKIKHGVILNENDRPLAYRVLGDTPEQDQEIPADQCIHVFDPTWHDQVRGLPSYAHAIKIIYGSMTATEREQMNQNIRSSIALIEYNENGGPDFDDPGVQVGTAATADAVAKPTVEHYAAGMIKYFRSNSGGKIESVDTNQPGDMWDRFQDRTLRMALGPVWPYEMSWKSSELNGVMVRNIQERARLIVEDRQDVLRNPATFTIRWAIRKAIKAGIIPDNPVENDWWKWDFQMPRKFSIDPGRDAQQRREDYKIGLINRTRIIEEEGGNVEDMDDQRIIEVITREDKIEAATAGRTTPIDRRLFYMLGPNEMASATTDPTPSTEEEP